MINLLRNTLNIVYIISCSCISIIIIIKEILLAFNIDAEYWSIE